jgi:hypothetical protein
MQDWCNAFGTEAVGLGKAPHATRIALKALVWRITQD